jgi:hypothetical protein
LQFHRPYCSVFAQTCFKFGADQLIILGMAGLQYTAVHVRTLLSLSRTELQRWLATLPPFSQASTQERTARLFTITDLVFFSTVARLHQRLELPLRTIAKLSSAIHDHMDEPAALAGESVRFFLNQAEDGQWIIGAEANGLLSISIDPAPIWESVYQFVGVAVAPQRELPLGLISLPQNANMERPRGKRAR